MNQGKLVFAQIMEHLPLSTFRRCVARYDGEHKVKHFSCLDQYLCMAFAQLTWRESLRDIEARLRAHSTKLYHLGIRGNAARNTLANATHDWRIYCDFAQRLIGIARRLYAEEPLGIELKETVYALDSTTIDLCLSVFSWAPFRSTKAAVKLHTLLDLRGSIPSFIFISDGKFHDVNVLDHLVPEPGAFYVMDRAYIDFERLARLNDWQFLRYPREVEFQSTSPLLARCRPRHWARLRPDRGAHRFLFPQGLRSTAAPHQVQRSRNRQTAHIPHEQLRIAGTHDHPAVSTALARGTLFQVDQTASQDQGVLRHDRERSEDANLDRRVGLRPRRHPQEAAELFREPL
jgi:uncharacterized protein DUF4372/DDE family transposase